MFSDFSLMSSSLSFFSDPLCGTRESADSAWNWYQLSIASTSEWSLIQTHVSFQTSFEAFAFQFNQRRTSNMMLQKFKFPCLLDTTDELLILNSQYFTPTGWCLHKHEEWICSGCWIHLMQVGESKSLWRYLNQEMLSKK